MNRTELRLGTRGSDLALAQSRYVAARIEALGDAPPVRIVIIKTSGDRILNVPLSEIASAAPGATPDERKGFFTKEIEDALLANEVDFAVHSYKDMPSEMVDGLTLSSMPQRLLPLDVLLFEKSKRSRDTFPFVAPGSRLGTSSVRRIAQAAAFWPDLQCEMLRGNVPTRVRKLLLGDYDAILLSGAGFRRLESEGIFARSDEMSADEAAALENLEVVEVPPALFAPAPAQGALVVQSRTNDHQLLDLLARLEDRSAAELVRAERRILAAIRGGCHLPLGAHALADHVRGGVGMHLFLGKEALDNRLGRSYHWYRSGSTPAELADSIIAEIFHELPLVLTGRADRMLELETRHNSRILHSLPLLQIQELPAEAECAAALGEWCRSSAAKSDALVAAFSVPALRRLLAIFRELNYQPPNTLRWAIVGEKTAEELARHLPEARLAHLSPDGTGESLARLLLEKGVAKLDGSPIIVSAAERGREEFFSLMAAAGQPVIRLGLYRTLARIPSDDEIAQLPEHCRILFGSPSSVRAFYAIGEDPADPQHETSNAELAQRAAARHRSGLLACAIGRTTAEELQRLKIPVYYVASKPDYDTMIEELP